MSVEVDLLISILFYQKSSCFWKKNSSKNREGMGEKSNPFVECVINKYFWQNNPFGPNWN